MPRPLLERPKRGRRECRPYDPSRNGSYDPTWSVFAVLRRTAITWLRMVTMNRTASAAAISSINV